ncbi:denn domain-containing protein, putative [Ixodes scapularis]|uniref:Denn domain-containing protein, putative n=1 Tax=Ixodes scapularis TaxID=6945 RepID=B7PZ29_IXOSC|nr:denn domain-containing protein, putative [Ixodes scapularis]|eukprot:XP_002404540.1 denn domain-containing protein, putative [Ixodes scapularis]
MITIFASMLHERRILITSKRLSRLSACVQAANALIYPMEWQHIFIPVLPNHLLDYLSAPMPFLIGVPTTTLARVSGSELGEVVVLDADNNKIDSPFRDLESIPSEIVTPLKRSLRNPSLMLGDGVSQAFLRALVRLIGGYREALCLQLGERITFDPERFLQSRPPNLRACLEKMLQLQIFHQFIEGRLQILNAGKVNNDIFELEVNMFDDSSNKQFKQHYKYWLANMKVKDKGKKAYSNIQGKFAGMQKGTQDDMALSKRDMSQPRSAPASPTMDRKRPVTFQPLPRAQPPNRLPLAPNPFVQTYCTPPYSGLQQRFQAVPYMGNPHPGLSTNPFVRQPWTSPMAPPPRPHAPPPAVPRQQDPFADLIDL